MSSFHFPLRKYVPIRRQAFAYKNNWPKEIWIRIYFLFSIVWYLPGVASCTDYECQTKILSLDRINFGVLGVFLDDLSALILVQWTPLILVTQSLRCLFCFRTQWIQKKKHLRCIKQSFVRGFEWLEILSLSLIFLLISNVINSPRLH